MYCKLTPKLFLEVFAWKFSNLSCERALMIPFLQLWPLAYGLSFLFSAACVIENHDSEKRLPNFPLSFYDIVTSRSLPPI